MRWKPIKYELTASQIQMPPRVRETQRAIELYCSPREVSFMGAEDIIDEGTLERAVRITVMSEHRITEFLKKGEISDLLNMKEIEESAKKRIAGIDMVEFIGRSSLVHLNLGFVAPFTKNSMEGGPRRLFSLERDLAPLVHSVQQNNDDLTLFA